jgi:hypothetical protein
MPSRYAQWMYDWEHQLTSVGSGMDAGLALP